MGNPTPRKNRKSKYQFQLATPEDRERDKHRGFYASEDSENRPGWLTIEVHISNRRPVKELGKEIASKINRWRSEYDAKAKSDRDAAFLERWRAGQSHERIARKLCITKYAVKQLAARHRKNAMDPIAT